MRARTRSLVIGCVLPTVLFLSCSGLSPAGFWKSYRDDSISAQHSDQGPWGGSRWIHWTSDQPGTFNLNEVTEFAVGNGWTCEEPAPYAADRVRSWVGTSGPVFPLFFGEPSDGIHHGGSDDFPRHIDGLSLIARCETGWMRVAPGTGESSPAYGYIQVNSVGTRMAVYHLWGET